MYRVVWLRSNQVELFSSQLLYVVNQFGTQESIENSHQIDPLSAEKTDSSSVEEGDSIKFSKDQPENSESVDNVANENDEGSEEKQTIVCPSEVDGTLNIVEFEISCVY